MTRIFESYADFLQREDKKENGVSAEFAAENVKWEKENETNSGCWDCSDCSRCSGCWDCSRCSDCSDLKGIKGTTETTPWKMDIPKIANIHQAIEDAVNHPKALDMETWHTCESTHCRAGWVVHLAGPAGYALEKETTTLFAAMQIYKASSIIRVSPVRYYETNEVAMADIKRCAAEEMSLPKTDAI